MQIDIDAALKQIQTEVVTNLKAIGSNVTQDSEQLAEYFADVTPALTSALTDGDTQALGFLRDRIALHTGRAAYDEINKNQAVINSTIMTGISILLTVAKGALLA